MEMITSKEVAQQIYNDFDMIIYTDQDHNNQVKKCAIKAVDLRLEGDFLFTSIEYGYDSLEYWQQVKQHLNEM